MSTAQPPPGYEHIVVRAADGVALASVADAIREVLATSTLHSWASRRPGAEAFTGRGTAWATCLPDGTSVVVRHSQHGGMLAWATRDLFLSPTRARAELEVTLRLERAGVPTAQVIAYAEYPAFGSWVRADVVTRRVTGADFPAAWHATRTVEERATIVRAVETLLMQLREAGAVHPDLNLRNILIGAGVATLIDTDRVTFLSPRSEEAAARNLARLLRSADKWNREQALGADLRRLLGGSSTT